VRERGKYGVPVVVRKHWQMMKPRDKWLSCFGCRCTRSSPVENEEYEEQTGEIELSMG